jgi:C-terminal processing protease CtpA/Prc
MAAAAKAVKASLGAVQSVGDLRAAVGTLTTQERTLLVDQALLMIDQVYVHLQLKHAMHAIEPTQRLKLLQARLPSMSEREFHNELISTYTHLRDLHTNYILPDPLKRFVAALPFRVEEFHEGDDRRYVVTQVSPLSTDPHFKVGVEPTHWNGMPIDRAVDQNAEREAGSNLAARHAQGLESLTTRWMGMSLPPDEDWVVLGYRDGHVQRETRFEWHVFEPGVAKSGVDPLAAPGAVARHLGIDAKCEIRRRVLKLMFSPASIAAERRTAPFHGRVPSRGRGKGVDLRTESILPDVIPTFRAVTTAHGTFGYVRVRTFNVDDEAFVKEMIRILGLLPQEGLILDVRGNGGGNIWAGERLLQLLSPKRIEPELFSFINTPMTLELSSASPELAPWTPSIDQSVETGATFSQGFPLTPPELCNSTGQCYQGPTVLITDALCYSTTDIFAAGFQDHAIGKILGTHANTGAGGANVWTHNDLANTLTGPGSPITALPGGADFRVAFRRALRVGANAGMVLEELGVEPDERHAMTSQDVLDGNPDLIEHAAKMLAAMPASALSATVAKPDKGSVTVKARTKGLDRIDVDVDGRPAASVDVTDGVSTFKVAAARSRQPQVELRGLRGGTLAACVRITAT